MSEKAIFSPYGAFEMKASYQKNMILGNLFLIAVVSFIISLFWVVSLLGNDLVIKIEPTGDIIDWTKPTRTEPLKAEMIRPRGYVAEFIPQYAVVVPAMIPDGEYLEFEDPKVKGKYVKAIFDGIICEFPGVVNFDDDGDPNGNYRGGTGVEDPDENQFVPFEKGPEMIYNEQPKYPRLCKLAGIEGDVIIKVLIDINGLVKKAIVAVSSKNESLDASALKAAMKNQFSPALQNFRPVSLWVSYKVSFKLE